MSDFLKDFLQQDVRAGREPARVYLAAFGKHPGWNDHIEDLELETQTLVTAKQLIYVEGISSQIDAGVWEKLDTASQHPVFDHFLLWQRPGEALIGLIVSSRDGKNRTRYPMVVCAHVIGVALGRVVSEVKPALEAAVAECRAVESATAVREILARTRTTLAAAITATAPASGTGADAPAPAGAATSGLDEEGLCRVLYEIKGKLGAWAPNRSGGRDDGARDRSVHLRVPQIWDEAAGWPWWTAFFQSQLDRGTPVLFLWPRTARWMDVIVGRPAAADFFALKAGTKALPLVNEVPYELDDAFRAEARTLTIEFGQGAGSVRTVFGPRERTERGAIASRLSAGRAAIRRLELARVWSGLRRLAARKPVLMAAVGAGVTAAVIWGTWRYAAPSRPSVETPARVRPAGGPAAGASVTFTAWGEYCHAYFDWFGAVAAALQAPERKQRWARDPYLRTKLVAPVEQARRKFGDLDPRKVAKVSGSLAALAETVPDELGNEAVRSRVAEAALVVRQAGEALQAWPALAQQRERRAAFVARGWAVAKSLPAPEELKLDGSLTQMVDSTIESAQQMAQDTALLPGVLAQLDRLNASGDPLLGVVARHFQTGLAAANSFADLRTALTSAHAELDPLRPWVEDGPALAEVDLARFKKEEATLLAVSAYEPGLAERWRRTMEGYRTLPAAEQPLTVAGWTEELAGLRVQLDQLRRFVKAAGVAEALATRIAALDESGRAYFALPTLRRDAASLKEGARKLLGGAAALKSDLARELAERIDPAGWLIQKRAVVLAGSRAVDAEWRKRRDAVLAGADVAALKADPERLAELQERVERIETFLRQLAAAKELPSPLEGGSAISDELLGALQPAVADRREAVLAELLKAAPWDGGLPRVACAEFLETAPAKSVLAEGARGLRLLTDFGRDFTRLAEWENQACGWREGVGSVIETWRKQAVVLRELMASPIVVEIVQRAQMLELVDQETDRRGLLGKAQSQLKLAERLAAWRRLGQLPDWPSTAQELAAENEISSKLQSGAKAAIKSTERLNQLAEEIAAERVRRWQVAFSAAAEPGAWEALFDVQGVFGVANEQLDARGRFNAWLYRAKKQDWLGIGADALAGEYRRAVEKVGELAKNLPAAQGFSEQLAKVSLEVPAVDFGQLGPAVAGGLGQAVWKLEKSDHPGQLRYTWKGHRLEFAPTNSASGTYLATTEMTVGLFVDWVRERGLRAKVEASLEALLKEYTVQFDDKYRRGPTAYVKGAGIDFAVSTRWISKLPGSYYVPGGRTPIEPTPLTPVNYVSPRTAKVLAESLGCRLPSAEEWLAARTSMDENGEAARHPNLRDRAWLRYWKRVNEDPALEEKKYWPDADIFIPSHLTTVPLGKLALPATDDDDEVLWFSEVNSGVGVFRHLVGNVSEFVTEGNAMAVIGGSALSPRELKPDTAYPVLEYDTWGFSDVGFRLAFGAGRLSPAQQIQRLVVAQGYVGPN